MNFRFLLSTLVAAVACGASFAEDVAVADAYSVSATADGVVSVVTPTYQVDAYPADVGQPLFWFDASDTTGWEFTTSGNTRYVTKIPSKRGSKLQGIRYLSNKAEDVHRATTPTSGDGDEWYGWWATDKATETTLYPMQAPIYKTDDAVLAGGCCIDFGAIGSRRALRFNNHTDDGCMAPSNALRNIGTVVAVYGSQNGGGWFLGGGGDGSVIRWHRAAGDQSAETHWSNPVMRSMSNSWAINGILRHDGLATYPGHVGFNHGWEVLGWQFTSADGLTFGPGIGDGRGYGFSRTGGQRIAEMLFFDTVLPQNDLEKVEAYLQKKWFGRTLAGQNGEARLASLESTGLAQDAFEKGITTELAVGVDESLAIDRVTGGRGTDARLKKTGAGTLALGDATGYAGSVELAGGTLDYPAKRTIPTADELPRDCWAHFDPSDEASLSTYEEDGSLWFNGLANLAGTQRYDSSAKAWKDFYLGNYKNRRCWMRMNALGEGLNVIDMGNISYSDGRYLCFTHEAPSEKHDVSAETAMTGITTYIAVYSARGSGGHFARNAMYERKTTSIATYSGWFANGILSNRKPNTTQDLAGTNGVVYIDGERVDPANGRLKTAGFQIVALQTSGYDSFTRLGISLGNLYMGGQMLGELFLYRRPLSETEIKDVSAYLAKKWFGRELVGYTTNGTRTRAAADLHRVDATGAADVRVAAGETVRVGALTGSGAGSVTKTGAGTLAVETLATTGAVTVAAGALRVTGPTDPATNCEIAADPLAWFDPTDETRMNVERGSDGNWLAQWYDKKMAHTLATHSDARRPQLKTDDVSGNTYVDTRTDRFMYLEKAIDSARAVYVIWRTHNNTQLAQMFGTMGDSAGTYRAIDPNPDLLDGLRGEDKTGNEYRLFRDTGRSPFSSSKSQIYTNGVQVTRTALPTTNVFELIEVHMAAPAHIAAIANDRQWNTAGRLGKSDFGDILIYDRVLTARERVATRNYLMKKWFNAAPQALPEAEVVTNGIGALSVAQGAAATFETPAEMGDLSGSGSVALAADASVADVSAYAGTVSVAPGKSLSLTKAPVPVSPNLVTDGLLAQFDASDASTVTLREDSAANVVEWRSKVGDWKAVTGKKYVTDKTNYDPLYRTAEEGLDGKRTILLQSNTILLFEQNGITNEIEGIKSAFWVFGTVPNQGGGFLLGGGKRSATGVRGYAWHRGGNDAGAYAGSVTQPLTCGSAAQSVKDANWYLNGVKVNGTTVGLQTNAWHYINCNFRPQDAAVTASGFAFDARILDGYWNEFTHRSGHQNLAEVLLYDRVLDDDERAAVEAYLAAKWGFTQKGAASAATVDLAEGATLDCGGHVQKLAAVTGSGSVVNGSLAFETLVADGAATAWPTLESCTISDGQVVELRNIPADPAGKSVKVLSADAFEGSEFLRNAVFSGEVPDPKSVRTRLQVDGNDLVVTFKAKGMMMIVR